MPAVRGQDGAAGGPAIVHELFRPFEVAPSARASRSSGAQAEAALSSGSGTAALEGLPVDYQKPR